MKITKVNIKDYLILKEVSFAPDGKLSVFAGKNRQGKTSIIKAIKAGLLGTTDPAVIRKGADKSEIMLDIDGLKIHRVITKNGQRCKVITSEGDIKASPQQFLHSLIGSDYSFDPVNFLSAENKTKRQMLVNLLALKATPDDFEGIVPQDAISGINFDQDVLSICKQLEVGYYAQRTDLNRKLAAKTALIGEYGDLPLIDRLVAEKRSVELASGIAEARQLEWQAAQNKSLADLTRQNIEKTENEIAEINGQIPESHTTLQGWLNEKVSLHKAKTEEHQIIYAKYKAHLDRLLAEINAEQAEAEKIKKLISAHEAASNALSNYTKTMDVITIPAVPDIAPMLEELDQVNMALVKSAKQEEVQQLVAEQLELKNMVSALTSTIDALRGLPVRVAERSDPDKLYDVSFDGDKIFVDGTAIDQLSTSEEVRFVLGIVKKLNKDARLKMLCLDGIESLDDETFTELKRQAQEDDWQYFITKVIHNGEDASGAIIIENGEIRG